MAKKVPDKPLYASLVPAAGSPDACQTPFLAHQILPLSRSRATLIISLVV